MPQWPLVYARKDVSRASRAIGFIPLMVFSFVPFAANLGRKRPGKACVLEI